MCVRVCVCACACACVHACLCMCMCARMCVCVRACVCACMCVCVCACVHVCACMCVCACVYVYVHICMSVYHTYLFLPIGSCLRVKEVRKSSESWPHFANEDVSTLVLQEHILLHTGIPCGVPVLLFYTGVNDDN